MSRRIVQLIDMPSYCETNRMPFRRTLGKEMINKAFELSLTEALEAERRSFYMLFSSEDQKEGMKAFIEKRKAEWKGR